MGDPANYQHEFAAAVDILAVRDACGVFTASGNRLSQHWGAGGPVKALLGSLAMRHNGWHAERASGSAQA